MRIIPILLAGALLGAACSSSDDVDDVALPRTGSSDAEVDVDTADLATDGDPLLDEVETPFSLTDACTLTTEAPTGEVRLAFPDGWLVGECGYFDKDVEILEVEESPDVDVIWQIDPLVYEEAIAPSDGDASRLFTSVEGLQAIRIAGVFPDDDEAAPGARHVTWRIDLGNDHILVGEVVDRRDVAWDAAVAALDVMAQAVEVDGVELDPEIREVLLRTVVKEQSFAVTWDEDDCIRLRTDVAPGGETVGTACDIELADDELGNVVRWNIEGMVVTAGIVRGDVGHVVVSSDEALAVGSIPLDVPEGPRAFASVPVDEETYDGVRLIDFEGETLGTVEPIDPE